MNPAGSFWSSNEPRQLSVVRLRYHVSALFLELGTTVSSFRDAGGVPEGDRFNLPRTCGQAMPPVIG